MRRLVLLAAAVAALALPALASAHPLGNFTINRFSRVEVVRASRLRRATCSTWPRSRPSRQGASTAHAYARRIARNAHLIVDGRRAHG